MRTWEVKCMLLEIEFKKLDAQTDIHKKVEPLVHSLKLFVGFICVLLSANWLAVIALNVVTFYVLQKDISNEQSETPIVELNNDYINWAMKKLLFLGMDLICNLIFIALAVYMLAVTI